MEDLLVEAYDLIRIVSKELKDALHKAQVDKTLIDGLDSLLALQSSAIRCYHLKTQNPGALAKAVKECKALLVKLEEQDTDK